MNSAGGGFGFKERWFQARFYTGSGVAGGFGAFYFTLKGHNQ